jgi:tyrosinase
MSDSDMWSDRYFGGNGTADDHCVVDGAFANLTLRWLADGAFSDHCLTRIMNNGILKSTSQTKTDKCNAITNYADAYLC